MELKEKVEFLKKSFIFNTLNPTELMQLSKLAMERTLEPGEFLYHEGESCSYFYILAEGKLRCYLFSSLGKELTLIIFLRSGEILGPTSVFRDRPSSGSTQALVKTKVIEFKRKEFISFVLDHPEVSMGIIKVLAARVSELNRRLRDVTGERVEQRLFKVMLALFNRYGKTLDITRHELAEMAGTTTETVIRILSCLKKRKIIASARRKITIIDETGLSGPSTK